MAQQQSKFAAGFAGFLIGLVCGLGIAACAAILITNSPIPFVEKVQKNTAVVDPAEELNGSVDPNARLNADASSTTANRTTETVAVKTVDVMQNNTKRDAQGKALAPGVVTPTIYWVQAGAFQNNDQAQSLIGKLAFMGIESHVSKSGNLYRVRIGPFDEQASAKEVQSSLTDQDMKSTIVIQKQ